MAAPLTLGERVQFYRRRARLSERQLAELAGISRTLIRMLERGETENPTLGTLRRIALACECRISDLIPDEMEAALAS
jgi:transcriptional regulator with XRE-family HTH domain